MNNIWEDRDALTKLETERNKKQGRLTFNCMNLKCQGDRAFCSKGHILGQAKDKGLALISVLRGITSGACKDCKEYVEEV
uniref:Uncharacterized protein n=1 Tax=viral metagenome TaxID=1070528 RepID=A0A6M3KAX9_9ZZZZ